jgi:hypothetical protein
VSQIAKHVYDNEFSATNVYGRVFEIVRRETVGDGVHLDVGCGFGHVAEAISSIKGVTYVGVDASDDANAALSSRGFEVQRHVFGELDADLRRLREVVGQRRLRSISILDTLEHLVDPAQMLRVLRALADANHCPLIISVPNVAHRDVGYKLAFGRFDYTPSGLLDETHLRFFTERTLERMTRQSGWRQFAQNDVVLETSDQRFPVHHVALAEGSALRGLLNGLRPSVDARVNQFVRAYLPAVPDTSLTWHADEQTKRPFLSVVMRTQGRRPETLREALLALTAQSDQDFEVLVIGHRLDTKRQITVERIIEEVPDEIRTRLRLILLDHGGRATPLNVGFEAATGHYISILDDDDVPLGHWVETFHGLAEKFPGRMLRAVPVRQVYDQVNIEAEGFSPRAVGGMLRDYPPEFDLFQHLGCNLTPNTALAFPRSVFHDLGLRFDETLTTTEDWDFLMRAAFVTGVASSDAVTCIYRWWDKGESSRTEHNEAEWTANLQHILQKFDREHIILPPGSATRLRRLVQQQGPAPRGELSLYPVHLELLRVLDSIKWKLLMPIRVAGRVFGRSAKIRPSDVLRMTQDEAAEALRRINRSAGMRLALGAATARDMIRARLRKPL